ncbi:MAG: TIGR04282 family arsenosugar biosynthesis glycosyltransferase [Thiohalospira sp.]
MTGPRLQLFARAPVAGAAKTRLIPALGAAGAARLQARLLRRALAVLEGVDERVPGLERELWCHPDTDHPAFRAAAGQGFRLRAQVGGDLGERMAGALEAALAEGAPSAVLVGSDCPGLTAGPVADAFDELAAGADAVLGPAVDGGYYLVGLRRPARALFTGIPWGGPEVAAATRTRAAAAGLALAEVATLQDLDTPADLAAFPELTAAEEP